MKVIYLIILPILLVIQMDIMTLLVTSLRYDDLTCNYISSIDLLTHPDLMYSLPIVNKSH